jgi:hypothetical protein
MVGFEIFLDNKIKLYTVWYVLSTVFLKLHNLHSTLTIKEKWMSRRNLQSLTFLHISSTSTFVMFVLYLGDVSLQSNNNRMPQIKTNNIQLSWSFCDCEQIVMD